MRFRAFIATGFAVGIIACATGTDSQDDTAMDSGHADSSTNKDTGTTHDTGTVHDTGTQQEAAGNCGGSCLGVDSTCCNNTCVDITSDQNNCGGCNSPCNSLTCCSGNCVDTMGSDDNNCGGCGTICTGTCNSGTCTSSGCTVDEGTCPHSPCTTGVALSDSCDPEGITFIVCDLLEDTTCCSSSWDSTCVSYAEEFEESMCAGC